MTTADEISTGLDELGFDGRPFDALAAVSPAPVLPVPMQPVPMQPAPVSLTPMPRSAERSVAGEPALPLDPVLPLNPADQQERPAPATAGDYPAVPGPASQAAPPRSAERPDAPAPSTPDGVAARVVSELRDALLAAHHSAMATQVRWQEQVLAGVGGPVPRNAPAPVRPAPAPSNPAPARSNPGPDLGPAPLSPAIAPSPSAPGLPAPTIGLPRVAAVRITYRQEGGLEPLATTPVTQLGAVELAHLADGRAGAVFGPRYEQQAPSLGAGPLRAVTELRPGGPSGAGVLRGVCAVPAGAADALAAARQAGEVLALWLGLHLCVPEPRIEHVTAHVTAHGSGRDTGPDTADVEIVDGTGTGEAAELVAEIVGADLVPRPWLRLDAEIRVGERVLARVSGLGISVREAQGVPLGTRRGGNPPARPVRRGITGELAVVDELALATASVGDLTLALGPEFARYTERRATRPPAGGLRLVGRVMAVQGTRGDLTGGATGVTEYDSATDAWYYGAAPSPTVPNVILMETSLQSALLLGYHLGATLVDPDQDYSLRNLDGSATLHREVDLRGRTIRQRSTLLTTTVLSGAVLQGFRYELWLDGEDQATTEPFYSGQSLFGFFNATALANQTGLDNGTSVPNWLEERPDTPVRVVDIAGRSGPGRASGPLDLIAGMEVVDGGGRHGAGYLRAVRPVDPDDWFFTRHFHLDPVMPGSLGIEAVIQALQEWLVDTGALDGLTDPEFVVPAGVELTWRYRGQILAGDGVMTLEVHVREVARRPGRVRVVADASLWRVSDATSGLRIYELGGIAAEAREKGAPSW